MSIYSTVAASPRQPPVRLQQILQIDSAYVPNADRESRTGTGSFISKTDNKPLQCWQESKVTQMA